MTDVESRLGSTLVNRYRIESKIQKGGMGTVFLATHLELGKVVAVKIFHADLAEKKTLTIRFINEAKGTASLHHRNIVDIIDIGTDEKGIPFFVMEYLKGDSLKDRLKRLFHGMHPAEAADIMIQVLTGLHVAHGRKIIHRDLKPGNIFISKEADGSEIVKILDFGVAKFKELEGIDGVELTTDGSVVGTPSFMSPEQATGKLKEVDHRSDLYSCGLILYRCLTGMNPFKGDTPLETIHNILNLQPPPPSFIVESIPKELDEIILKSIDKDKTKRYQDCRSFVEALKTTYDVCKAVPAESVEKIVTGKIELQEVAAPGDGTVDQSSMDISFIHDREELEDPGDKGRIRKLGLPLGIVVGVLATLLVVWGLYTGMKKDHAAETDPGLRAGLEEKDPAGDRANEENLPLENSAFVSIGLSGLPERATVLVDNAARADNPLKLERADTPVLLVVSTDEGKEILRKYIVPKTDATIYLEDLDQTTGKTKKVQGKPAKKPVKTTEKPPAEVEPEKTPPTEKPPTKTPEKTEDKKDKTRKIFQEFPG